MRTTSLSSSSVTAPSASRTSTRWAARPRISSESRPLPGDDPHALAGQPGVDVGRLGHRQALHPVVDRGEVEADRRQLGALQAEDGGVADGGHGAGGGDEGLRGDAVGEHAGAPDAVPLDDGDLGPELCGDQGGLVAGRSAADDHDAGHGSFPGAERTFAGPFVHRVTASSAAVRCSLGDGPLRRVRVEHGSRADAAPLPLLPAHRHRLDPRLAAHLRRRGVRLGGRAGHARARRGAGSSGVFVALYDLTDADERALDAWEGADSGPLPAGAPARAHPRGDEVAYVYVLDAFEGGLPSARHLGGIADAAEAAGAPTDYVTDLRSRDCRSTF